MPLAAGRGLAALAAGASRLLRPVPLREAERAIERALPDAGAARRRRWARRSHRLRAAARWDGRVLARLDDVALCARLRLEGWDRMPAAAADDPEPVYLRLPGGCPQIVARAMAVYRAPLTVVGGAAGSSPSDRDRPAVRRLASARALEDWLRDGAPGAVLVGLDAPGAELDLALPGGSLSVAALPFRLAAERRAPLVPISGRPRAGGWTISVEPPLEAGDGAAADLAARFSERLAAHLAGEPAAWPWTDPRWRPR